MGGLSVDIDSDDSIFTGDQSVEKGAFPLHSVSIVNEMFLSIEFNVPWEAET